jgi:hypothetical protein
MICFNIVQKSWKRSAGVDLTKYLAYLGDRQSELEKEHPGIRVFVNLCTLFRNINLCTL